MKQATLCLLLKDNKILLAMKKRGFGVGRWKEWGESYKRMRQIIDAIIRETKEEIGVRYKKSGKSWSVSF